MAQAVLIPTTVSVEGMMLRNGKILPSFSHSSSNALVPVVPVAPENVGATICTSVVVAVVSSRVTCRLPEDDAPVEDVVIVGEVVRPLGLQ